MANRIAQIQCAIEASAGLGDDQNLEKEQKNAGVAAKKIDTKKKEKEMNEYGIESIWLQVEVGDPCLNKKSDKKRSERRALRAKFAKRRSVKLHSHEHSLRNKKLERVTALEVRYELAA